MTNLHDIPGVHYTYTPLPAAGSGANTAYEAIIPNPLPGNAYVDSIDLLPIEAITGDDTNSNNYNVDLAGTTEIANLDLTTGNDAVRGTPKAFTISGSAAQRTVAAGGLLLVEREEVGTQPARIAGHMIRVGWKGI